MADGVYSLLVPASCDWLQVDEADLAHEPDESVHVLLGDIFAKEAAGTLE